MNYKVIVAVRGKKMNVDVVASREKAALRVIEIIESMIGEYVVGGQKIDPQNDTLNVPVYKNNVHVGDITAAPTRGSDRPLTGKFKELKLIISKLTTPATLCKDVSEVMIECTKGEFPDAAEVAPGISANEMGKVAGAIFDPELLEHCCAALAGRAFRLSAQRVGIDVSDSMQMNRCIQIMDMSARVEKAAVPLIIAHLQKKLGEPVHKDIEGIQGLKAKLNAALERQYPGTY